MKTGIPIRKGLRLTLIFLLLAAAGPASAEEENGVSMERLITGVKSICGGSGKGSDLKVKGAGSLEASKTVSLILDGKLEGDAEFSKEEWDGIRGMRDNPERYSECVQNLTPLLIEKFAKK